MIAVCFGHCCAQTIPSKQPNEWKETGGATPRATLKYEGARETALASPPFPSAGAPLPDLLPWNELLTLLNSLSALNGSRRTAEELRLIHSPDRGSCGQAVISVRLAPAGYSLPAGRGALSSLHSPPAAKHPVGAEGTTRPEPRPLQDQQQIHLTFPRAQRLIEEPGRSTHA